MILDSIVLENFGTYGGCNEAILTPEPGRPIILFGGMNGGGKTTLLDAIQLAFYGPRARLSNRGKLGYREYLRESIHRGADPGEGAAITLRFRRLMEGETRHFELQRSWRDGARGIEETVRVHRDGKVDDVFTEHWDEAVEGYLPSGIAHLFFFDGEQIKELAEGGHTAEILGTAIHSLLGLDLVDRLETDLKVFERRKRAEGLDPEAYAKLAQARVEVEEAIREEARLAQEIGARNTEMGQLEKIVRAKEEQFRTEGGELYVKRKDLEAERAAHQGQKASIEAQLRELVAGPLPLLMISAALDEAAHQARAESEIRRARVLSDALEVRDRQVLAELEKGRLDSEVVRKVSDILEADRRAKGGMATEPLVLDATEDLASRIQHLRADVLPAAEQQARRFIGQLTEIEERLARIETEIGRVPSAERVALVQEDLDSAREACRANRAEATTLEVRLQALQRHRNALESRLDKVGDHEMDGRLAEDDRLRMLKHSHRVRDTLKRFRTRVVKRHAASMEVLMLESFRKLLRKQDMVTGLSIDAETYEATLAGRNGKALPFDRLSAGERQLLATSLLWGLARSSGRPIPTVIDTPLGRLDSSHRRHLVERYFPSASHQVILLSTDEEIVGTYREALQPFITRTYLLAHSEAMGTTVIQPGYFSS